MSSEVALNNNKNLNLVIFIAALPIIQAFNQQRCYPLFLIIKPDVIIFADHEIPLV